MDALRATGPALPFGLRSRASGCLTRRIAFWLQLDNAYWADTSAAIVSAPECPPEQKQRAVMRKARGQQHDGDGTHCGADQAEPAYAQRGAELRLARREPVARMERRLC